MSFAVKNDKCFVNDADTNHHQSPQSGANSPSAQLNNSNKQNSLRSMKLARRARSFKDDVLGKISQIRTPTNTLSLGRSHSPNSRNRLNKGNHSLCLTDDSNHKPLHDLNYHVRQVKNALQHFKDVISRNKLEVLPGNGTIVLESIANVHTALQPYTLNENSSAIISATTQVYLSLGKLIKLCDEVLLSEDNANCASLSKENVSEVVELVDNAVQNLVKLANEKMSERDKNGSATVSTKPIDSCNLLQRPEVTAQRISLPDIPLTPRERDILEQSQVKQMRTSHSIESILRDSSPPPPKPPLPGRSGNPPPLPPKRKFQPKPVGIQLSPQQQPHQSMNDLDSGSNINIDAGLLNCGLDRMSLRSKSPDDNSSLLSTSSLDSALNHSREEDELKALTSSDQHSDDQALREDIDKIFAHKNGNNITEDVTDSIGPITSLSELAGESHRNPRDSHESGFVSMHSIRASMQSVSAKRLSSEQQQQQQQQQQQLSSFSAANKFNVANMSITSNAAYQHQKTSSNISNESIATTTSTTSSSAFSDSIMRTTSNAISKKSLANSVSKASDNYMKMDNYGVLSFDSLDGYDNYATATRITSNSRKMYEHRAYAANQLNHSASEFNDDDADGFGEDDDVPPALPIKIRSRSIRRDRHLSQYDNLDQPDDFSNHMMFIPMHSKHQSLIEPRRPNHFNDGSDQPPPLPVKKKHMFQSVAYSVMAYMEMFGNCSHTTHNNSSEFLRHSVHTCNLNHHSTSVDHFTSTDCHQQQQNSRYISHSQTMSLSPLRHQVIMESSDSLASQAISLPPTISEKPTNLPPALPPKRHRTANRLNNLNASPPSSPNYITNEPIESPSSESSHHIANTTSHTPHNNNISKLPANEIIVPRKQIAPISPSSNYVQITTCTMNAAAAAAAAANSMKYSSTSSASKDSMSAICLNGRTNGESTEAKTSPSDTPAVNDKESNDTSPAKLNLVEEIDVQKYLMLKKDSEDGPDVKGGELDALIVHATKVQKFSENAFGEAFITTFRTFITPSDLIEKLIHRYTLFCRQISEPKQKSAKESFSLLVRVVNDLTAPDLTSQILQILNEFVYQLVCSGQLMMAKLLRNKILEKIMLFKKQKWQPINPVLNVITSVPSLLDLKTTDIAEQMTLLDAELFQKIEIPEVLIWAQEQCEERSPNLTRFTEHFNKMSYWARSQILKQEDSKDREKHVVKFIKIMKHLRKINNYNSYLALLSALDSAPIRRLEWHKTITEGLKEYCALIDSSSSFRAYRQALAETNPPCIPYIGLVLQDLTFVHIGNPDYLSSGVINFSKRWQQHNIVVNMKRFKKCSSYPFKKSSRIIGFFDNFDNYLDEDAMWQISETIKPRVTRKPMSHQTN